MNDTNRVLILGASGGIGGEVARQLVAAGWDVRALKRNLGTTVTRAGITWFDGDAMNANDVSRAAAGCSVIVHAVNPPGYQNWPRLVLPMLDNTIAAAKAMGATVVLPGTLYNFSPEEPSPLTEDSSQQPRTRKGAIRREMEDRLRAATNHGVRVLIVRAGDYFGPGAANNWFSQGLIKPGKSVSTISNPGAPGIGHQWAYLPDVAQTMVKLLEMRWSLPAFASFHMAGHWDSDGTQMARTIQRVVHIRSGLEPAIRPLPWWLFKLVSPFVTVLREMQEMRYLWQRPVQLDGSRLAGVLGKEPHTPLDEAVETTLRGLGCIA